MKQFVVQYRTHPEHAADNQRAVEAVFAELRANPIAGFSYQSLRLEDDTFLHVVNIADGVADDALTKLPAFQAFQGALKERCAEPPRRRTMTIVGSHGG